MPLVAGGEEPAGLPGHPAHLLALVDGVSHEFFGEHVLARAHRPDGGLSVEVQRQGDDDRLDVRVGEQLLVGAVYLHLLAGRVLGLPAVLRHQPRPGLLGGGARDIAMEGAMDVERADVGDRDDVEVVGRMRSDEHAPLIAGAEHADTERIPDTATVSEVDGAEPRPRRHAGGDRSREEVPSRDRDRVGEVVLADLLLLLGQVHRAHLGAVVSRRQQAANGHQDFRKYSRPFQPPDGIAATTSRAANSVH